MKQIKTKSRDILIHEIKFTGEIEDDMHYNLPKELRNYPENILGKLSDLTDKDCEEFVLQWGEDLSGDLINVIAFGYSDIVSIRENKILGYKNYIDNMNNNYTLRPKESFISLLQSKGINTSNGDKLLIIKML